MSVHPVHLPSGLEVALDFGSLHRMCVEEYAYYDGVDDPDPNRITPVDVAITIAVNSWVSNAPLLREVHRGMADACDPFLSRIPANADLQTFDRDLELYGAVMDAACGKRNVAIARASKVLARKRRGFFPMLDSVLINAYLSVRANEDRESVSVFVCREFRADLRSIEDIIAPLVQDLANWGFLLTPVRVFEMMLWTQYEERGYYFAA